MVTIDWKAQAEAARAEAEQLRVQLAGCLIAAEGGATGSNVAPPGSYGWSMAYDTVRALRARADVSFRVSVVAVISWFGRRTIGSHGKILLGKRLKKDRAEKKYVLPGGRLEGSESFEDALRRECREEVGLDVRPLRLLTATRSAHVPGSPSNVALIFLASPLDYAASPVSTAEIEDPAFFSLDDAELLDVMPVTRDVFQLLRAEDKQLYGA